MSWPALSKSQHVCSAATFPAYATDLSQRGSLVRKEPHPARRLLKTILMYRVMSTTYRLQAMYHGLRVKYWTERMFLQYYSSPVVNGLGSLARQERLLLQATKNMLLPWAKSYPSHRRRWLSATLRERAYSESDPGESTQP